MAIKTASADLIITFITLLTNVVEGLLGLRIILRLFGASTAAPFVAWLYDNTNGLLAPFRGMFPNEPVSGNFVIEFSSLFALLFYAFIGYLIIEALATLNYYSARREKLKA